MSPNFGYEDSLNAPHAEEESEDIRLFLLVQLSDVFVRAHLAGCRYAMVSSLSVIRSVLRPSITFYPISAVPTPHSRYPGEKDGM